MRAAAVMEGNEAREMRKKLSPKIGALLKNGEVYTFGAGNKGQLGHGSTNNEYFPQVLCSLKASRRLVHQVACGNNCTLILAGSFHPPSLLSRCMEVLRENPELMHSMESRLPAELVSEIRSYPDLSAADACHVPRV